VRGSRSSPRPGGGRHRYATHISISPSGNSIPKLRFLSGLAAVLAALTVVTGVTAKSFNKSVPAAGAEPAPRPTLTTATAAPPMTPFPTDDRGFINSAARCDGAQTPLALGRTRRSLVVICVDPSGKYEYRGVRLSDGASLTVPAETRPDGGFVARSDDVTYSLSASQLLATAGDTVINREPMIDYRQPHPFAAETGAAPESPSGTARAPAPPGR
jgi:hypothetical protein